MNILKKKPSAHDIFNLTVFIVFIIGVIIAAFELTPIFDEFYEDCNGIYEAAAKTGEYLREMGHKSILIFSGIQILQVIIAAIPGMAIQFAGGMVYGVAGGTFYSLMGITIGTVIIFYISRIFGMKAVSLFIKEETYDKFKHLADGRTGSIVIFVMYLVPGLPKDVFTYILGISPVSAKKFFIYSTLGRLPGIIGSCIIGYTYITKNYWVSGIILAVSAVICILCIIFKNKIIAFISRKNVV